MRKWAVPYLVLFLCLTPALAFADPLPSWRSSASKAAILDFVSAVTDPGGPDYRTPAERIAVFDNDGTLWAEQPVYFQLLFSVDRVAQMVEADPTLAESSAVKAAATGDFQGLMETGEEGLLEVVALAHAGMDVADFKNQLASWLESARHPDTGQRFDAMVYQPMLELLSYLRDNDFKTFIVSGGGVDFIRVFAESVYGIPPEQVIGSQGKASYVVEAGVPAVMKEPGIFFIDDKEGKPIAIERIIGRRPLLAGGNSDGDLQMLEWTTAGEGRRLGLIVHHTDAEREWAYDRESHIGRLDKAMDLATERNWPLVDMARDWRVVFPYELSE